MVNRRNQSHSGSTRSEPDHNRIGLSPLFESFPLYAISSLHVIEQFIDTYAFQHQQRQTSAHPGDQISLTVPFCESCRHTRNHLSNQHYGVRSGVGFHILTLYSPRFCFLYITRSAFGVIDDLKGDAAEGYDKALMRWRAERSEKRRRRRSLWRKSSRSTRMRARATMSEGRGGVRQKGEGEIIQRGRSMRDDKSGKHLPQAMC